MYAVSTISGRQKSAALGKIPALERYEAPHIAKVAQIARVMGQPFYILSGFFGLIEAGHPIERYDYSLPPSAVPQLAHLVQSQMKHAGIDEVLLYHEGEKENWLNYICAMEDACTLGRVRLTKRQLLCA